MIERLMHLCFGASLAGAATACDASSEVVPPVAPAPDAAAAPLHEVAWIDQQHWQPYAAELDPLPSHQPPQIDCEPPGWQLELDRLEVRTGECNYVLLEHPAQAAVPQGSEVALTLWHFDLTAPEPARAHVAVFFGDALQWETDLAIPQPGNAHAIQFRATRPLAVGDPVRFHLHNHGENSWLLSDARALVAR